MGGKYSAFVLGVYGYGLLAAAFGILAYRFMRTRYVRARKCQHITSLYPEGGIYMQRTTVRPAGGKKKVITDVPSVGEAPMYCRRCIRAKLKGYMKECIRG